MEVLIIGAGRMGIRHAQGVFENVNVSKILIIDVNQEALNSAKNILNNSKISFSLNNNVNFDRKFDIVIIASTANNRIEQVKFASKFNPKAILIEKPLGQSIEEVVALENFASQQKLNCYVNLNMRLYESIIKIKGILTDKPQLFGKKTISINTGTIGIGANGIHYLDLLFFLMDANRMELVSAKIDDDYIPSSRDKSFLDFGGWAIINFFRNYDFIGSAHIILSSFSTAFGSWEILGQNGRVWFNEVDQKCIYSLRKENSQLPINRYYGDYLPNEEFQFKTPFLGEITNKWLNTLVDTGVSNLPTLNEALPVHYLLFEWLNFSKKFSNKFPIT